MTSIEERALAIPLVLEDIIDLYDQLHRYCIYRSTTVVPKATSGRCRNMHIKALVKIQRVSRTWQATATRLLWRSYARVENLGSIVAPSSHPNVNHWPKHDNFSDRHQWSRFLPSNASQWPRYSRYIRTICLTNPAGWPLIDRVFFVGIQPFLRDEPLLLPRLHTLIISEEWLEQHYAVQNLMLLLSPVMRHLELNFNHQTYNPTLAEDCLSTVVSQAPNLRVLKISLSANRRYYPTGYFEIPPPFSALANLGELEYFGFPPNWASCSLLQVLSSLPKLRLLDFQYNAKLSFDTHRPLERSRACTRITGSNSGETMTTAKLCFPALESFLFHSSLHIAQRLFSSKLQVPELGAIDKLSITLGDKDQLGVCKAIAAPLAGIKTLKLNPVRFHASLRMEPGVIEPECLYAWEGYSGFKLTHLDVREVVFENDLDTATLFPSWPNLKRLTLLPPTGSISAISNYQRAGMEALASANLKGLTLETLGHAASNLKQLEVLRLTLVASSTQSLPPAQDVSDEKLLFQCLKTLKLEESFLNFQVEDFDWEVAARYISSLFAVTSGSMSVATPSVANQRHPDITLFDSEDNTLPLMMAGMLSRNGEMRIIDGKSLADRWLVAAGYHEEYLKFHRELSMDVFGRLDARAHQNNQAYERDRTHQPENKCSFCSKLRQLDSCCDSDLDTDTDCSWDSSDNSGDESDESIVG